MARKPVVSRTIKTYNCNCLVYDKKAEENIKYEVHLNRNYKDNKMLNAACRKHIPDNFIFVTVLSDPVLTEQKLFLTLDEFIDLAHPVVLPDKAKSNKTNKIKKEK